MKRLDAVLDGYLRDIKKRVAKEYTEGNLTTKEFQDGLDACEILRKVSESSKGKKEKKGESK